MRLILDWCLILIVSWNDFGDAQSFGEAQLVKLLLLRVVRAILARPQVLASACVLVAMELLLFSIWVQVKNHDMSIKDILL